MLGFNPLASAPLGSSLGNVPVAGWMTAEDPVRRRITAARLDELSAIVHAPMSSGTIVLRPGASQIARIILRDPLAIDSYGWLSDNTQIPPKKKGIPYLDRDPVYGFLPPAAQVAPAIGWLTDDRPAFFKNAPRRDEPTANVFASATTALGWWTADEPTRRRPALARVDVIAAPAGLVSLPAVVNVGWFTADEPTRRRAPLARLEGVVAPVLAIADVPAVVLGAPVIEAPRPPRARQVYIAGYTTWTVVYPIPPPIGWLSSDQDPPPVPRNIKRLDWNAIGWLDIPPPAPVRTGIGWFEENNQPPIRRRTVNLDESVSVLAQTSVAAVPYGWLVDNTDKPIVRRRAVSYEDAPPSVASVPPSSTGWLESDRPRHNKNRVVSLDKHSVGELRAIPPSSVILSGWLVTDPPARILRRQVVFDSGQAWPASSTPAISFGWFESGVQPARRRQPRYPDTTAWIGLPTTTPVGWLSVDEPARRRVRVSRFDDGYNAGLLPVPVATTWWLDSSAFFVKRRRLVYLDQNPIGRVGGAPPLELLIDPDYVLQYPPPTRLLQYPPPARLLSYPLTH